MSLPCVQIEGNEMYLQMCTYTYIMCVCVIDSPLDERKFANPIAA